MNQTILKIFTALTLISIFGCEGPPSPRRAANVQNSENSNNAGTFNNNGNNTYIPGNSIDTNDDSNTGGGTTIITIPDNAKHCQWSLNGASGYQFSHAHLGAYNICHDQNDDKIMFIQLKTPVADTRVCFFPLHFDASRSTYIGQAKCILITDSKIKRIDFLKDRSGFSSLSINGVMMMKDEMHFFAYPYNGNWSSTQAYLHCNQYLQAGYPDFCTAFKQVNAYVAHKF